MGSEKAAFEFDTEADGCVSCGMILEGGKIVLGPAEGSPPRRHLFHRACYEKHTEDAAAAVSERLASVLVRASFTPDDLKQSYIAHIPSLISAVTVLGPGVPGPQPADEDCLVLTVANLVDTRSGLACAPTRGFTTYQRSLPIAAGFSDSLLAEMDRPGMKHAISVAVAAQTLQDCTIPPQERGPLDIYVAKIRKEFFLIVRAQATRNAAIAQVIATVAMNATVKVFNSRAKDRPVVVLGNVSDQVAAGHYFSRMEIGSRISVNAWHDSGVGRVDWPLGSLWAFSVDKPATVAALNPFWRPNGEAASRPLLFCNAAHSLSNFPPCFVHGTVEAAYVFPDAVAEVSVTFD